MSPPKADNKSEAFPFGEGGSAKAETDEVVSFWKNYFLFYVAVNGLFCYNIGMLLKGRNPA